MEKKNSEEYPFPFVARTFWFFRWGLLLTCSAIYAFLIANYSRVLASFDESSWFIYAGFWIIFLVYVPYNLIITFFSRTVFDETHIERTTNLLTKKRWLYEEIEKVETGNTGHIRIGFSDGQSIKIWSGEANLPYVLSLLLNKCGPRLAGQ